MSSSSADSCRNRHRATRAEDSVQFSHTTTHTKSTINAQIQASPSAHQSNHDRQQPAVADFEIFIKPLSLHSTKPDPSTQAHPPQLHLLDFLFTSATAPAAAAATASSSHHRGLGEGVEESDDDGFRTPTNTIPSTAECPPAPKKAKSRKRTLSSLLQEEISQLYCGNNDLVMEVEMWLQNQEEEDRKKRMRMKARRQAGKFADATSA